MKSNHIFSSKCTTHLKQTLQRVAEQPAPLSLARVLDALAAERGSIAAELLKKSLKTNAAKRALAPGSVRDELKTESLSHPPRYPKTVIISETAAHILVKAVHISAQHGHRYVGTEHLLKSLLETKSDEVYRWLSERGIRAHELEKNLHIVLESTAKFPDLTAVFRNEGESQAKSSGKPSALEYFGRELTSHEVQKNIDPVIGREREIERVIHILCRRYKNNPLLLGEAGVGKTAIVEGLAKRILAGDVPTILANKKIVTLDLGAMVAGTMYRGEFEARLKQILETAVREGNVILFIDEMHTVIGAGAASGSLDAANMLKPMLARGDLSVIGATTLEEYKKHIEGDSALERRLAPILVNEPSEQETLTVLAGIKKNYETYHNVTISDEAIEAAVELSARFLPEKLQPDKSIDLLDEAAARVKVSRASAEIWNQARAVERALADIQTKKRLAVEHESYHEAIALKDRELALARQYERIVAKTKADASSPATVTREHIAAVVSAHLAIPLGLIHQNERERFATLEEALGRFVVGQSEALAKVANLIRRAATSVSDPNRPQASFLLLGPSGVGKTETARALSHTMFGNRTNLVALDMSEYAESYSISKLVGSPAGYVGYRDRNAFTDKVRANPYSVVLLDEIEKAHPEVFNLLLSILEEGSIKDATGRLVNFRNTVIVMTSNIGSEVFNRAARLGFGSRERGMDAAGASESHEALEGLKERFRPEFLNRIDATIVFKALTEAACEEIAARCFGQLNERLARVRVRVTPALSAIKHIVTAGYRPEVGARGIRRYFQDHVEAEIARKLLEVPAAVVARSETREIRVDVSGHTLTVTEAP